MKQFIFILLFSACCFALRNGGAIQQNGNNGGALQDDPASSPQCSSAVFHDTTFSDTVRKSFAYTMVSDSTDSLTLLSGFSMPSGLQFNKTTFAVTGTPTVPGRDSVVFVAHHCDSDTGADTGYVIFNIILDTLKIYSIRPDSATAGDTAWLMGCFPGINADSITSINLEDTINAAVVAATIDSIGFIIPASAPSKWYSGISVCDNYTCDTLAGDSLKIYATVLSYYHPTLTQSGGTGTYSWHPADSGQIGDTLRLTHTGTTTGYLWDQFTGDTLRTSANRDTAYIKITGSTDTINAVFVADLRNFYCRADGTASDKNTAFGPSTRADRCMTLYTAQGQSFLPDDTLFLADTTRGGRFNDSLSVPSSGTAGHRFVITCESGGHPVISGSNNEATPSYDRARCIIVSNKNYVTVNGIETRYSGGAGLTDGEGIVISGTSSGIKVSNCNSHHHKNDGFKVTETASCSTFTNNFHDNSRGSTGNSDVSQHNRSTVVMIADTLYGSPFGVENIDTTVLTMRNCVVRDTTWGVVMYQGPCRATITGCTFTASKSITGSRAIFIDSTSRVTVDSCTISKYAIGILLDGTGNSSITNSTFDSCYTYGIDVTTGDTVSIHSNLFRGVKDYGVYKRSGATALLAMRNRFTRLPSGLLIGSGFFLTGDFKCFGNVHDSDASYCYNVSTANASSIIANAYINESGLRPIEGTNNTFIIRNCAVRGGSSSTNYRQCANATIESCISSYADLPDGNGNHESVTFTNAYKSIVIDNPDYAVPRDDSIADGGGVNPGIPEAVTYFNGAAVVVGNMDIGAMSNGSQFSVILNADANAPITRYGDSLFLPGELCTLTCVADSGYAASMAGRPYKSYPAIDTMIWAVTADSTVASVALELPDKTIDTTIVGEGSWTVLPGLSADSSYTVRYTATAAPGWRFSEYRGTYSGASRIASYVITENHTDTCVFLDGSETSVPRRRGWLGWREVWRKFGRW